MCFYHNSLLLNCDFTSMFIVKTTIILTVLISTYLDHICQTIGNIFYRWPEAEPSTVALGLPIGVGVGILSYNYLDWIKSFF